MPRPPTLTFCKQRCARQWAAGLLLGLAGLGLPLPAAADAARLAQIEAALRGRPEVAAHALQAAAAGEPAAGPVQVEMLLVRGLMLARMAEAQAVEQAAQQLEALGDSGRRPLASAAAGLLRARWVARGGPLGRADRLLTEAVERLPADAPAGFRLRFVAAQAGIRESMGKLDDAVRLNQEAVTLADAASPAWRRAELRSALAYSLYLAQQMERAQAVSREAVALATQAADHVTLFAVLNTEGILLGALGQAEDELRVMTAAIGHARIAGSVRDEVLGLANLADFYLKRGDYATALRLSLEALPLARNVRDQDIESVALANAGLALISMGRRDEGIRSVRESLMLEERAGALTSMAQTQYEFGLYLEKAGFLKEAWAAFSEHRRLADEVFQRQHQQAMLELQEAFDSQGRQRELALLNTEKGLKEAQLLGRDLQQRLSAVGIAAGALLLLVVAVLVRRMRRSNAALSSSNALLKVAGERDSLTGLTNRRHFQAVMAQTTPSGHLEGSMLLIDIDHFKRVNDAHGHAAGDAVLVELAGRLRAVLRDEDLCARWGGEEFLVLVRRLPAAQVETLAERLLVAIGAEPVRHGRSRINVTASIGFATFPLQPALRPLAWERAIDLVDTAMYLAKAHGRNRAYGVRALHTEEEQALPADGKTTGALDALERAWRRGHADLTQLAGPRRAETRA